MDYKVIFALCAIVLLLGCTPNKPNAKSVYIDNARQLAESVPIKVASLSPIELTKVDTAEKYQAVADRINAMIRILNEKTDRFQIPQLDATRKGWDKISKFVIEYGPLIKGYNNVISAANVYKNSESPENLNAFYTNATLFGIETAVIVWAVFYSITFETVGAVYRGSGLNRLAFECGACMSVVLSDAHWALRTIFVEGSSQAAQKAMELFDKLKKQYGFMEIVKNETNSAIQSGKNYINSLNLSVNH